MNLSFARCVSILLLVCINVLPCAAQIGVDRLGTFVPFGNKAEHNEHLARTLKNEQELKFRTRVLARRGIVLVEFSLPTCPACDPAAKTIVELVSRFGGKVDYVRLDLNKNLGLSYKYDVPEVPAVLLFKDGRLEERYVTYKENNRQELAKSISRLITEPPSDDESSSQIAAKKLPALKLIH